MDAPAAPGTRGTARKVTSFCRICEALCGVELTVEDGAITDIAPDGAHVATAGFGCVKGLEQHRLYASPDRVRRPLARVDGELRETSWEDALGGIGAKVRQLRADHGPSSIAMYVGTAAGFSVLHPIFAQGFMAGIGSNQMYASATQDCSNKFAVADHVYGFPFTQPFPDLEHTRCLIVVGANPVISKWSFLQVTNPAQRLRELAARGTKLHFVDPRRTESAKAAGEHVFIRPATDVFFYLAFLHELIATGGVDRERVERHTTGYAELERLARPWTPERAGAVTGIAPATLRAMVRDYREADGAALYSSTGVNMGRNGALAFWIQEAINAISGNLDRRGGTLVGRGVIDFPAFGVKHGVLKRPDRSRIGDFASVNDAFPAGVLADEILTPGAGQVRALFVTGGNPLITMPNAERLKRAFESLELLVTVDIYANETGSVADYVLPATSPFERPDLPFIFPLMLGLQSRPYLQATRAVVRPDGEQRDEATIYTDLARACGTPLYGSRVVQGALDLARRVHDRLHPDEPPGLPQERLLSLLLRATGQGSFAKLLAQTHGRPRTPHRPGDFLGERVTTDDGKVHLAPPALLALAEKLDGDFERERASAGEIRLITKRAVTTHNSWTHNLEDFTSGKRATNYLYVHPQDAERLGLAAGALADVQSATGAVRVPVELNRDLMPGTVALPHGWGHQHAKGLSVASRTTGVNVNVLAADGPDALEGVSGMAHLTGIPVEVTPAAGPLDPTSWTGIGGGVGGGGERATP